MFGDFKDLDDYTEYVLKISRELFKKLSKEFNIKKGLKIVPEGSSKLIDEDDPRSIHISGITYDLPIIHLIYLNEFGSKMNRKLYLNDIIIHELTHVVLNHLSLDNSRFEEYYAEVLRISGLEVKRMKYDPKHFTYRLMKLKSELLPVPKSTPKVEVISVEEAEKLLQKYKSSAKLISF